jgi:tetratricopeptide (TPR) repeat protein
LHGVGTTKPRLQAATARGLTRFVGRDAEYTILLQALKSAESGHGQLIAVSGEAGVGKSRLLYELLHSNSAAGWLFLEADSVSHGRGIPYFVMSDFLRDYFKIDQRDDTRAIREKVTAKILMLDASFQETIPPVLNVLEVLPSDNAFHRLEATQRRRQTAEAIKRLVLAESRLQPIAMLFEDLQSCDTASLSVLDTIAEGVSKNRVLLIVSYRPDFRDNWADRSFYSKLDLQPLSRGTVNELLRELLGNHLDFGRLEDVLAEGTGGNPFFIEEMVRTLIEMKILGGEPGYRSLLRPVSSIQVPPKVQDVIAARIDRLPPLEKRLIREAATIGKNFSFGVLSMLTGLPETDLRECLSHLKASEFMYETNFFPDLEYTFKHSLTHQVAYGGLLHETRASLHAKVLRCLEHFHAGRLNEHVEQLAEHAYQGKVWAKAVTYLRQAGQKSLHRSANREAVGLFEQALKALQGLPEERDTLMLAIDIRFDLRNALQPLGDLDAILDHLHHAEELAEQVGDQRRLGWVASYITEHFRMLGNPEAAAKAGQRALRIGFELGDFPLQVVSRLPMGLLYHATGDYRCAIENFKWIVGNLGNEHHQEHFGLFGLPSVHSRSFLAWCLAEIGEFDEGLRLGEEAVRLAKMGDHPSSLMYAHLGTGVVHLRRGSLERAILEFERALALVDFAQIPVGFSYGGSYLGYALSLGGRTTEGIPLLEQSANSPVSKSFIARHSLRIAYLGEGYLLAGRVDDAATAGAQALALARQHRERGHEAYALRLLGEVMIKRGDAAQAEAQYRAAIRIGSDLGMRPFVAHCHWGFAKLSAVIHDGEAQGHHAAAARVQFEALGMVGWIRHLDVLNVPSNGNQ